MQFEINEEIFRVLIVDDDIDFVNELSIHLSQLGYEPIIAKGNGDDLIYDALEKSMSRYCHVALVDISLRPPPIRDTRGIELVKKLKYIPGIIITNYSFEIELISKSHSSGAVRVLGKHQLPNELDAILKEVCNEYWAPHPSVEWIGGINQYQLLERFFLQNTTSYHNQVNILLNLCFRDEPITVLPLRGHKGYQLNIPRTHSAMLRIQRDSSMEFTYVKIGLNDIIENEINNYNLNLRKAANIGGYVPKMTIRRTCWDLSCVVFEFHGVTHESLKPFSSFFQSSPVERINSVLDNIFDKLWRKYYENYRELNDVSLFDIFDKNWGGRWTERVKLLVSGTEDMRVTGSHNRSIKLQNPFSYVYEYVIKPRGLNEKDKSYVKSTCTIVTHGDLLTRNIYVESATCKVALCDYKRLGEGSVFQDFSELEIDILVNLLPYCDIDVLCNLFYALYDENFLGNSVHEFSCGKETPNRDGVNKTFKVIRRLRKLARNRISSSITDMDQYYWGLLFNAVYIASLLWERGNGGTYEFKKAVMIGGLLCNRIEHLHRDESWMPSLDDDINAITDAYRDLATETRIDRNYGAAGSFYGSVTINNIVILDNPLPSVEEQNRLFRDSE